MRFEQHWIDAAPYVAANQQPVFLLTRTPERAGDFWVPTGDFLNDPAGPCMSRVAAGDAVRVPVHAFRTRERSMADVFGLGVQVGLVAMVALGKHTGAKPLEVHLVLGTECPDLWPTPAFRCYVGVAVRTG